MVKHPALVPGKFYHIYNRGNNRENIFIEEKNYEYFLNLYAKYVVPVVSTYAYCLLKNHFHFLVQIKDDGDPSKAFSDLFNSYAKAINKTYQRTGALFEHPFKRIEVKSDAHLIQLVTYIHQNPQKHGFVKDFRDWPFSSFSVLSTGNVSLIKQDEVLDWFGGRQHFIDFHQATPENIPNGLIPEDEE